MKLCAIVATILSALLLASYVSYRLGQTSGFEMGFTQGMYSFAKTADEQRKQPNGDVVFSSTEWPDTMRGLGDLHEHSGAADFVPWKHNPVPAVLSQATTPTPQKPITPVDNKSDGSVAMKPMVLVDWLNRIVTTETIEGARFDYSLKYINEKSGYIEARWTFVVDATPEGRRLVGDGIAVYHRRVNALLEPLGLVIEGTYNPGQPFLDEVTKTIIINDIITFGPRWKPTQGRQEPAKK